MQEKDDPIYNASEISLEFKKKHKYIPKSYF